MNSRHDSGIEWSLIFSSLRKLLWCDCDVKDKDVNCYTKYLWGGWDCGGD